MTHFCTYEDDLFVLSALFCPLLPSSVLFCPLLSSSCYLFASLSPLVIVYSFDGYDWVKFDPAPWSPRVGSNVVVYSDRLFLIGGMVDGANHTQQLLNDVWTFYPVPYPPTPILLNVTSVISSKFPHFLVRYQPIIESPGLVAPIEEAFLETLDGSLNLTINQGNTFNVLPITMGKEYQFHVKIKNAAGWSDFSAPTAIVKIPLPTPIIPHNNTKNDTVIVYAGTLLVRTRKNTMEWNKT